MGTGLSKKWADKLLWTMPVSEEEDVNHLEIAHRMSKLCLAAAVGALSLLTMAACGIFSSDPTPTPAPTAAGTASEESDLYRAVWTGDVEEVRKLVVQGADVNAIDEDGDPLLREAVWRGHVEVVQALINAGADVDARDSEGDPILSEAVWRGHTEIARILVDAGADVSARRADGESLLYVARWRGHTEIEELLVEAGAEE